MIINIYSYNDAKLIFNEKPKNWISVRDLGYSHLYEDMDEKCSNVLELYFDDVTNQDIQSGALHPFYRKAYMARGLICFSEEMARDIVKFAEKVYNKGEELNIHCWAGKSRSQAIGHCLNIYYNLYLKKNDKDYLRNLNKSNGKFHGNYDVIRIMTNELYNKRGN